MRVSEDLFKKDLIVKLMDEANEEAGHEGWSPTVTRMWRAPVALTWRLWTVGAHHSVEPLWMGAHLRVVLPTFSRMWIFPVMVTCGRTGLGAQHTIVSVWLGSGFRAMLRWL